MKTRNGLLLYFIFLLVLGVSGPQESLGSSHGPPRISGNFSSVDLIFVQSLDGKPTSRIFGESLTLPLGHSRASQFSPVSIGLSFQPTELHFLMFDCKDLSHWRGPPPFAAS